MSDLNKTAPINESNLRLRMYNHIMETNPYAKGTFYIIILAHVDEIKLARSHGHTFKDIYRFYAARGKYPATYQSFMYNVQKAKKIGAL